MVHGHILLSQISKSISPAHALTSQHSITTDFCACTQADHIERFLVVHGQILLSQIKAYPNKDVQRSQFVTALKQKMESRRHNKLYYSKRGFSKAPGAVRAVNRNPMKVRVPEGLGMERHATSGRVSGDSPSGKIGVGQGTTLAMCRDATTTTTVWLGATEPPCQV